jgi:hypothetical protein
MKRVEKNIYLQLFLSLALQMIITMGAQIACLPQDLFRTSFQG